jgi:hypothetical protein
MGWWSSGSVNFTQVWCDVYKEEEEVKGKTDFNVNL